MIFRNALLSLKKNIGKSILLFVIMAIIANLIIANLAIKNATNKSMEQIRSSLGNDVTLSVDMRSLMGNRDKQKDQTIPTINEDMAEQIKGLKYVEDYNYILSVGAYSESIEPVELSSSQMNDKEPMMQRPSMNRSDFTLQGQLTMETIEEFVEEKYVLTQGRLLSEDDNQTHNCVIETQLALDNDLEVGDSFQLYVEEGKEYEFIVAGIFDVQTSKDFDMMFRGSDNPYNKIYTSLDYLQEINGSNALSSAVFYLDDPKNIDSFISLAKESSDIDFEVYTLESNDFAYERSVSSLENLETFTSMFLIVVIVAGSAILCLILILTIKGRFYEFGILLSLGQSKVKIIAQQFIEMFIIVGLALCLSIGTGKIVANGISGLLQSATSNTNPVMMEMSDMKPTDDNKGEKPSKDFMDHAFKNPVDKEMDVSLDTKSILQLSAISVGISLISVLAPSLYILRLSPREILIKREG